MRIGLLALDKTGRIAVFNAAAERILGYRAGDVLGRPCEEIFPGLADSLAHPHSNPAGGEAEMQQEVAARGKDGQEIRLAVTAHVTSDPDDASVGPGAILVFQDARELEKMENQLRHLNRLQSLDQFAAGIVHEIRNPLAGISTNAQHIVEEIRKHCQKLCKRVNRSDHFHEEMQDILADVQGIENIVKKVLDFAHPTKSQVQEVPVEEIVNEVLRFSRMPLRRQGIRLLTYLSQAPAKVRVDVSQMKQVFFNIIRNACDAMPEGGELIVSTTATRLRADNRHVRVEMQDTGRGIAEEHLDRIFDPFFSTHREGTGLGLAISRKIVESHGGHIDVKSEPGKGTEFGIVLPVA